jgi:hypothetical protein
VTKCRPGRYRGPILGSVTNDCHSQMSPTRLTH